MSRWVEGNAIQLLENGEEFFPRGFEAIAGARREVGLREVFVTAYGESARTFPARFPILSLDRIFVRNASVHLPVVLPRKPWSHLSDHAPLAAEIHL